MVGGAHVSLREGVVVDVCFCAAGGDDLRRVVPRHRGADAQPLEVGHDHEPVLPNGLDALPGHGKGGIECDGAFTYEKHPRLAAFRVEASSAEVVVG